MVKATTVIPAPEGLGAPEFEFANVERTTRNGKPFDVVEAKRPTSWPQSNPNLALLWHRYLPAHDMKDFAATALRSPAGVDFSEAWRVVQNTNKLSEAAKRWHGFGVLDWYCETSKKAMRKLAPALLALHAQRKDSIKASGEFIFQRYEVTHSLTAGMGWPATLENSGIAFEQTYGFPIIPAKSLKGVLRHFLEEEIAAEMRESKRDRGRLLGERTCQEEIAAEMRESKLSVAEIVSGAIGKASAEVLLRAIGQSPTWPQVVEFLFGDQKREGILAFWDGWALPRPSGWFAPSVLTPHHNGYLAGKLTKVHLDQESPVPVQFLTVTREVQFEIPLSLTAEGRRLGVDGGKAAVALADYFLGRALDEWGVGGRTGASFGRLVRP